MKNKAPLIAIDGPAAAGATSATREVANKLGFHALYSGGLYRAVGFLALQQGYIEEPSAFIEIAKQLPCFFKNGDIFIEGRNVTRELQTDEVDQAARIVAQNLDVRQALRQFQLDQRRDPGLVAEGRDMCWLFEGGLIVRIYLTARAEVRARRRCEQLDTPDLFHSILDSIVERDEADMTREHSPLKRHPDAICIDSSSMNLDGVVKNILAVWKATLETASR